MRGFMDAVIGLRRARQPFATAVVVGRQPPVSAHLGDRAIVRADGRMEGFIGGACSREIIRRQALDAIRTGRARLVSIRPGGRADASDPEHVVVPMTCVSEGAVDVYVEPAAQPRRLIVVGATPVADALARTGAAMDYEVVRAVEEHERRDLEGDGGAQIVTIEALGVALAESGADAAVVVASQGHYDEQALEAVLRAGGAAYVGLLASRTRGATVVQWLRDNGVPGSETVQYPAGMDLGARTAPDVAISILAEIVRRHAQASATAETAAAAPAAQESARPTVAVDPVCGMDVAIAGAKHVAESGGRTYYFCCANCRTAFLKDPAAFPAPA